MKRFALAIGLLVLPSSCDQGQTITGASDELRSAIDFQVIPLGKASDQYREMDLYDYEVSITNGWRSPVYLTCSNPKIHSDYIVKRNPETINYMTMGLAGARHLSNRGLSGSGGTRQLKQGEQLSFIAPMPVIPGHDQPGTFKIHMTFYLDPKLSKGRTMMSVPIAFHPNG